MVSRSNMGVFALILLMIGVIAIPTQAQSDSADGLPLLRDGTSVSIIYTDPQNEYSEPLGDAFGETIVHGIDSYELSITWSDVEVEPGVYDMAAVEGWLSIMVALDMQPYVVIKTIDTVNLNLPTDLMNPNDPTAMADGLHFDDPMVIERFQEMLDVLVPLVVDSNGFFISVGNEIDGWLATRPNEVEGFVNFVAAARDHIHGIEPQMGVGATILASGVKIELPLVDEILAVSDAAVFTYYPLKGDFTVEEPSVVADDMLMMVEKAGGLPILLQEVGYPSGYTTPANGSSGEKQRQFVENVFDAIIEHPEIRFVSFLQLSDWSVAECEFYGEYYGVDVPTFQEYLCTLGFHSYEGNPKPAYAEFLTGLERLNSTD